MSVLFNWIYLLPTYVLVFSAGFKFWILGQDLCTFGIVWNLGIKVIALWMIVLHTLMIVYALKIYDFVNHQSGQNQNVVLHKVCVISYLCTWDLWFC